MTFTSDCARGNPSGTIKIIGLGQSLRGDDAAGLAAVHLWQEKYQAYEERPNLKVELAGFPGIGLLNLMGDASLVILVDAVHSGAKTGTIHLLSTEQLAAFEDGAASAHGWGVAETLTLGQNLFPASMPEELVLIGIEAGNLNLGEGLSPEVESALPEAARLIEQVLRRK